MEFWTYHNSFWKLIVHFLWGFCFYFIIFHYYYYFQLMALNECFWHGFGYYVVIEPSNGHFSIVRSIINLLSIPTEENAINELRPDTGNNMEAPAFQISRTDAWTQVNKCATYSRIFAFDKIIKFNVKTTSQKCATTTIKLAFLVI